MDWTSLAILTGILILSNLYHLWQVYRLRETVWKLERVNYAVISKLNELGYFVDIESYGSGSVATYIYPREESRHEQSHNPVA